MYLGGRGTIKKENGGKVEDKFVKGRYGRVQEVKEGPSHFITKKHMGLTILSFD